MLGHQLETVGNDGNSTREEPPSVPLFRGGSRLDSPLLYTLRSTLNTGSSTVLSHQGLNCHVGTLDRSFTPALNLRHGQRWTVGDLELGDPPPRCMEFSQLFRAPPGPCNQPSRRAVSPVRSGPARAFFSCQSLLPLVHPFYSTGRHASTTSI